MPELEDRPSAQGVAAIEEPPVAGRGSSAPDGIPTATASAAATAGDARVCRNCGALGTTPFCGQCGQSMDDRPLTARGILSDLYPQGVCCHHYTDFLGTLWSAVFDLTDLKVTNLDVDTGASATEIFLPANAGTTLVDIDTGASSVKVHVPTGVGARLRIKSGVASVIVDESRFHKIDTGQYQSDEYNTAANRADITIDSGVGSIEVK